MINASPVWSSGVLGAVLIVLTVVLLRALILGRRASFSIGLATVAWLYFLLAIGPFSSYYYPAQLPTDVALVHLAGEKYEVPVEWVSGHLYPGNSVVTPPPENEVNAEAFRAIGHALITLALAFCGGVFSVYVSASRNNPNRQHSQPHG
jgi:hypothetical protein